MSCSEVEINSWDQRLEDLLNEGKVGEDPATRYIAGNVEQMVLAWASRPGHKRAMMEMLAAEDG